MRRRVPILLLDEFGSAVLWKAVVALRKSGPVHVLSAPSARSIALSRYCGSFRVIDRGASESRKLLVIERAIARTGARVLLPLVDWDVELVVRHRERLERRVSLPWLPTLGAHSAVVDKRALDATLRAHGLPRVPTVDPRVARADVAGLAMPVLWKPAVGGAGHGIRRFDERAALDRFLDDSGAGRRGVVQAVVEGGDVDVSVLCRDGEVVAWTSQEGERAPGSPYGFGDPVVVGWDRAALEAASPLLRALRWSGVMHIDMRRDRESGTILPVDVSPRLWATVLASVAAGMNFPALWAQTALGAPSVPDRGLRSVEYRGLASAVRSLAALRGPRIRLDDTELGCVLRDPLPRAFDVARHRAGVLRSRLADAWDRRRRP